MAKITVSLTGPIEDGAYYAAIIMMVAFGIMYFGFGLIAFGFIAITYGLPVVHLLSFLPWIDSRIGIGEHYDAATALWGVWAIVSIATSILSLPLVGYSVLRTYPLDKAHKDLEASSLSRYFGNMLRGASMGGGGVDGIVMDEESKAIEMRCRKILFAGYFPFVWFAAPFVWVLYVRFKVWAAIAFFAALAIFVFSWFLLPGILVLLYAFFAGQKVFWARAAEWYLSVTNPIAPVIKNEAVDEIEEIDEIMY